MAPLYELNQISKVFTSGSVKFRALKDISLDIGRGDFVALAGPSGSGKSTLLNILGLIEVPSSGEISFFGHQLNQVSSGTLTEVRRKAVGFIFQNFNLVPVLSALENVEYPLYLEAGLSKREIRERARQALDAIGLSHVEHHRPSQLSGGQRQRVAIARAIVKRPQVVIADEPTANLDSKTAKQIVKLLGDLNRQSGTTVIIASHDPSIKRCVNRVVDIQDGELKGIQVADFSRRTLTN